MMPPKFANLNKAGETLDQLAKELHTDEFTIVENPSYIYRPLDIYPMPPKITSPRKKLTAIVKDMDGTTTTTEELCVHSLEFMVGKICGLEKGKNWDGLDHSDHPHIIGNSTTKHVEYLIRRFGDGSRMECFREAYFFAVLWTLSEGKDPGRREEILANLRAFGLGRVAMESDVRSFLPEEEFDVETARALALEISKRHPGLPRLETFEDKVRASIDIYYQRYHEILAAIDQGRGEDLSRKILGNPHAHLIEPMPGVAVFLAAVKGWLGEDLVAFGGDLAALLEQNPRVNITPEEIQRGTANLSPLGRYFESRPLKVAVVTSSIEYEARIVLREVFKVLHTQVAGWELSREKKELIGDRFSDYQKTYDAFITATDSSEMRLKPHPDLYSMALHRMGIDREDLDTVIGFEDSESGTRAIRAAGVGLCVALPFPFTSGHDLTAASHILEGGLPEAIIRQGLFLDPGVLS